MEIMNIVISISTIIGWEIGKAMHNKFTRVKFIDEKGGKITVNKSFADKFAKDRDLTRLKFYQWLK